MMAEVAEQIFAFIRSDLAIDTAEIASTDLLFSTGVVDSFALISLMMFIETEYAFRISPGDVNLVNFDSVDRMVAFVERSRS